MLKQENGDRPIRLLGYDFMRKMHTRRICPNVDGIRNSIRVLTLTKDHLGDVGFRLSTLKRRMVYPLSLTQEEMLRSRALASLDIHRII